MCFWFLIWLQVILNKIYQRIVELEINIEMLVPCQSALVLLRYFSKIKLTFEILTVRGQQHSSSTHEWVFLGKCQSFWDRKCIDLRGTQTPNLRINAEYSNLLSYQGHTFAVPCCWILALGYRYLWSKVNIGNINCALATAFIFDTQALIWNLKVRFMGVVIGQGNAVSPVSDSLLFFCFASIWPTIYDIQLFEIRLWKKSMSRSWVRSRLYSSPGTEPMHFLFVMRKLDKLFVRSG